MTFNTRRIAIIDLKQPRQSSQASVPELSEVLKQLVGEPFLFARLGYAGELTLHFGTPRPADHPKMRAKGVQYGSHVLSVCASAWVMKGTDRLLVEDSDQSVASLQKPSSAAAGDVKTLFTSGTLIPPGTRVVELSPYEILQTGGIALVLELADDSGIVVKPVVELDPETGEPVDFPDWELKTPAGLARVGPGPKWQWEPRPSEGPN